MYFYEVLQTCDEKLLTEEFLKLCTNSPDLHRTREVFTEFLKNISSLAPEFSDEWTIFMTPEQDIDGQNYFHVYARNAHDPENFSFMITPWKEVLGWIVSPESLSSFDKEVLTAAVLWEITWFGYDEETIQERVKSWENAEFTEHDLIEPEGDECL